jgi:HD superfamily phosphohydrolase
MTQPTDLPNSETPKEILNPETTKETTKETTTEIPISLSQNVIKGLATVAKLDTLKLDTNKLDTLKLDNKSKDDLDIEIASITNNHDDIYQKSPLDRSHSVAEHTILEYKNAPTKLLDKKKSSRKVQRTNSIDVIQIDSRLKPNLKKKSIVESPTHDAQVFMCKIYDPVWKIMTISNVAKIISKHPVFDRMKYIAQLGPVKYHIPSATHSRYEHLLGTAYLARIAAQHLQRLYPCITDAMVLCVEIAGLCHDIGHGAFSHLYDDLLRLIKFEHNTIHHELRSQIIVEYLLNDIIKNETTDNPDDRLSSYIKIEDIRLIQFFIDPESYRKHIDNDLKYLPKYYQGLEQIVSNSVHKIDVDKMDYLLRDGRYLGFDKVLNNSVDIIGLLNRCSIIDGIWAFSSNDQGIVYDIINRRLLYHMNAYGHPDVTSMGRMLSDAIINTNTHIDITTCAKLSTEEDILKFCTLTDDYIVELIVNSKDNRLSKARELLQDVLMGDIKYKHIGDFVNNVGPDLNSADCYHIPWGIFTDKSNPTNLLPKVKYHQNGVLVSPDAIKQVSRVFIRASRI